MRTLVVGAVVGALLVLAAPAAAKPTHAETGVVIAKHLGDAGKEATDAKDLGVGWASIYVGWAGLEPEQGNYNADMVAQYHQRFQAAKAQGLKVNVTFLTTPAWASGNPDEYFPPTDPNAFGSFVSWFAGEFGSEVDGYAMGNEPNGGVFWKPAPDPVKYAGYAKAGVDAVNAKDGDAVIFVGNTTGADDEFMEEALRTGMGDFDGAAFHSGTACNTDHPDVFLRQGGAAGARLLGSNPQEINNYSHTAYRELADVLLIMGFAEEFVADLERGWSTAGDVFDRRSAAAVCDVGAGAGKKPAGVTEAEQSLFLRESLGCAEQDPKLRYVFIFSLYDAGPTKNWDERMGLIRGDGTKKPAYDDLRPFMTDQKPVFTKDAFCGGYVDHVKPAVELTTTQPVLTVGGKTGAAFATGKPLPLSVKGTDQYPIIDVDLFADGKEIPTSTKDGAATLTWQGAKELSVGEHTITATARDEAGNTGQATPLKVLKVDPATLPPVAVRLLTKTTVKGRNVTVSGGLEPKQETIVDPTGRLQIVFTNLAPAPGKATAARKKRKRLQQKYSVSATKPFKKKVRLRKAGRWSLQLVYKAPKPFKSTRTKPKVLKIVG